MISNDNPTRVYLHHPDETQYESLRIIKFEPRTGIPGGVALDLCERDSDGIVAIVALQEHEARELVRKLGAILDPQPKEIEP